MVLSSEDKKEFEQLLLRFLEKLGVNLNDKKGLKKYVWQNCVTNFIDSDKTSVKRLSWGVPDFKIMDTSDSWGEAPKTSDFEIPNFDIDKAEFFETIENRCRGT